VGAGVARASNGSTYYVLQAAYTSAQSCGDYESPSEDPDEETGSGWIVPVKIATPDSEGRVYHVVESGQSLWAIAVAYQVTIRDLEIWNNLSRDNPLQVGQSMFIPGSDTEGYHTPTPVGMVQLATPDSEGKIVHTVQEYQTLTTIAKAYRVQIEIILGLNGIQAEWPLSIGQELVIDPGFVTPSPTRRPIERLTPESDGNYYHIVQPGETLSWIATLYEVTVTDLPTPTPVTSTLTPTVSSTATPSIPSTQTAIEGNADVGLSSENVNALLWVIAIGLLAGGIVLSVYVLRRKR
jgi:LysM repeat protein